MKSRVRATMLAFGLTTIVLACTSPREGATPTTGRTGSAPPGSAGSGAPATDAAPAPASASALTYVPLDSRTYVQEHVINGWVNRRSGPDLGSIADHAWNIWGALNQPSGQTLHGTPLPVWETWFSEGDVFVSREDVAGPDSRDLDPPNQSLHHGDLAGNNPSANTATVVTFNRYNREMRDHIHQNRYYDRSILSAMQSEFDLSNTEPADRTISDFPNTSVMLKPVWWIVPGGEASTMPYWAGETPDVATDQRNPDWKTWKQCVVVDPTGKATTDVERTCNAGQAGTGKMPAGSYDIKMIDLDPAKSDLYAFKLTEDEVAGLAQFKLGVSNLEGKQAEVKVGDYALLVAMHVGTREIADWTWQTHWWAPQPSKIPPSPPDAQAPTDSLTASGVPRAFAQFQMCTAYFMATPAAAAGAEPFYCFNPYLETNLTGLLTPDRSRSDELGIHSNCMSCHLVASTAPGAEPEYASAGTIAKTSPPWFGNGTGTQFLWSLALQAHPPPFDAPVAADEVPAVGPRDAGTTPGTVKPNG